MNTSLPAHKLPLNEQPLSSFKPLFASLPPPDPHALHGIYRAEFTGPAWLRKTAPIAIALGGLRGWWGKRFDGDRGSHNLVRRGGRLKLSLPITLAAIPSLVDGRTGVTVQYPRACPFPWPWVVDELRQIGEDCLLGMTIVNVAGLRRMAFPFLLHRQANISTQELIDEP
jgi:hypothetical protein